MRVLIVEDNRRLSAALARSLADAGYAVDAAYDGVEGEQLAAAAPYDAIILDILLPAKDGLAVYRDCYVTCAGAYYSAPYRLVGQTLWLRSGARTVAVPTLTCWREVGACALRHSATPLS